MRIIRSFALGLTIIFAVITSNAIPAYAETLRQEFKFSQSDVFKAILYVLPTAGFHIKYQDENIFRITASASMSAFSAGEQMSIAVVPNGRDGSTLEYNGIKNISTNIFSDRRVLQNFNKIVFMVSQRLESEVPTNTNATNLNKE